MKNFKAFSVSLIIIFLSVVVSSLPQSSEGQNSLEKKFDSSLSRNDQNEWMKTLSAHPHHVGSRWDKRNAEFILDKFKSWGFDAHIETFYVLFPTPKSRLLEMTSPKKFKAQLEEPPLKEDKTSDQLDEQLPTYNAYSADGDVTG